MNIFIDEAGIFRTAQTKDSWCVVLAYLSPEIDRSPLANLIKGLRFEFKQGHEAKLGDIPEARYARFLEELSRLRGIAFAVAVDVHYQSDAGLQKHRDEQAERVAARTAAISDPDRRRFVAKLAEEIHALPVQLYSQFVCQLDLAHTVISRGVPYFAQFHPQTLKSLRWRLDGKDKTAVTAYEKLLQRILANVLQTRLLEEPMRIPEKADLSNFSEHFFYPEGREPTYLREFYGIDPRLYNGRQLNEHSVFDDLSFADSKALPGLQVADLLASGLRRALRMNFDDPMRIATLIGANLVQHPDRTVPVKVMGVGMEADGIIAGKSTYVFNALIQRNKPYNRPRPG